MNFRKWWLNWVCVNKSLDWLAFTEVSSFFPSTQLSNQELMKDWSSHLTFRVFLSYSGTFLWRFFIHGVYCFESCRLLGGLAFIFLKQYTYTYVYTQCGKDLMIYSSTIRRKCLWTYQLLVERVVSLFQHPFFCFFHHLRDCLYLSGADIFFYIVS